MGPFPSCPGRAPPTPFAVPETRSFAPRAWVLPTSRMTILEFLSPEKQSDRAPRLAASDRVEGAAQPARSELPCTSGIPASSHRLLSGRFCYDIHGSSLPGAGRVQTQPDVQARLQLRLPGPMFLSGPQISTGNPRKWTRMYPNSLPVP